MNQALLDYYRCPESFATFTLTGELSENLDFFLFAKDTLGYERNSSGSFVPELHPNLYGVLPDLAIDGASLRLPFDSTELIENLHCERNLRNPPNAPSNVPLERSLAKVYRLLRPALNVHIRKHLQRFYLRVWERLPFPSWPID